MKIEHAKQLTEQALDKLIQALETGKSEALKAYLATMSRFHRQLGPSSSAASVVMRIGFPPLARIKQIS